MTESGQHLETVRISNDAEYLRDERDAADLADLLRMGWLPEAWITPPVTRELRELVRHRATLVALRSNLKCQVHAVLAACGVRGHDGYTAIQTIAGVGRGSRRS